MVRSRHHSPFPKDECTGERDTQGSVELGQKQRNVRRSLSDAMSETHISNLPEIPDTQIYVEPQITYMQWALNQLSEPFPTSGLSRAKSMLIHAYLAQKEEARDPIMTGGIIITASFHHAVSPAKSPNRIRTLLKEGSSVEKNLKTLTRQASLNMGTLPGSARARTPSLQLRPLFLRSTL